jgi:two-component system cell cycle response regulator
MTSEAARPQAGARTTYKAPILIADDSATIRLSLKRALEDEFTPIEAVNGEQAWELLSSDDRIELVITDLSMPELDGYGLVKRIRESVVSRIQNIPVIVVTGAEDTAARERAFEAGANDFLMKNSDRVELLARLRAHQKLVQTIRQLEESQRVLREQANTDALTALANRRFFEQIAGKELALMRRQKEHLTVIMMDIDHFKSINDTYGHQAGDHVLKRVAQTLSSAVREEDVVARVGGEEFVVSSPYTNRLAALVLAERLRKAIEDLEIIYEDSRIDVTMSLGIAVRPQDGDDLEALKAVADERLYTAKQTGRNRFCASDKAHRDAREAQVDMVRPKMDEALAMIAHGNLQRVIPHLPKLLEEIQPLLELANVEAREEVMDLDQLQALMDKLSQ